jgi:hypothetical protein
MENKITKTEQTGLTKISNEKYWEKWGDTRVSVHTPAPDLYRQNLPALSSLNEPKTNGVLVLQLVILEILDFIGQEWNKSQITECSELAYQEYYWFNTGELKQFSQRVKTGYFGKIYGKFAPTHLMEYFKEYSDEVWEARADYYGKQRPEEPPVYEPLTPEEKQVQDHYFATLKEIAKKLSSPVSSSNETPEQQKQREEKLKNHMDFFKSTLTPEQLQEIEDRKKQIEEATKKYENERKG